MNTTGVDRILKLSFTITLMVFKFGIGTSLATFQKIVYLPSDVNIFPSAVATVALSKPKLFP